MAKQLWRVYWYSNDDDQMTREVGLVYAETAEEALVKSVTTEWGAENFIHGEFYPDAFFYAEAITEAYQLEDVLGYLLWETEFVTCTESRRLIINGVLEQFSNG